MPDTAGAGTLQPPSTEGDAPPAEPTTPPADFKVPEGFTMLPAGEYVPKAVADANTAEAVRQRIKNLVARDKAAEDPAVVQAVLARHNQGVAADIERVRAEEAARFKPDLDRFETVKARLVEADILRAATAAGVKDWMLTPLPGKAEAPIVEQVRALMAFHDDLAYPVARSGDGFAAADKPTPARPFAGADFVLKQLRADKAYADLFKPEPTQPGAGYRGGNGAAGPVSTEAAAERLKATGAFDI